MVFGVYLFNDFFNNAIAINDEANPVGAHVFAAVHAFFNPGAIGLVRAFVFIGQQVERQAVLIGEFVVRLYAVGTYAYHHVASGLEGTVIIAQVACLGGTTRSVVFGVEIKRYFFAFELIKADGLAFLIGSAKVWGFIAHLGSAHKLFIWV